MLLVVALPSMKLFGFRKNLLFGLEFVVLAGTLAIASVLAFWSFRTIHQTSTWVDQAFEVRDTLSELLAALQDGGRAVLVGEPTANDAMVRTLFQLPDGKSAVSILTGRLERAVKDRGWPVRPDHAVASGKDQKAAVQKWLADKQLPELPAGTDDRPPEDPQLDRALAALRESLKGGGKP